MEGRVKLRCMCDVEIGIGRYATVTMPLPDGALLVSTRSTGIRADGSGAVSLFPQPDECRHCGCTSPESPCRYCGTACRT